MDSKSGQIMWSKNAHQPRAIASTTKVMTGILVLENANLSDTAVASKRASDVGESEIYLTPGEILTVEQLLYSALLKSANDATMVLAEKIGGSVEGFAKMMNDKAKSLGMLDSHFTNPHGLTDGSHRSSAHDLARLARYAMRNQQFRKIVATRKAIIPWPGKTWKRTLENHNKLLGKYKYAIGIKTGYTEEAGHCLVSAARDGDKEVIAVVLGASSGQEVNLQSEALLDWGLKNFSKKLVIKKNRVFAKIKIKGQQPLKTVASSNLSLYLPSGGNMPEIFAAPDRSIKLPVRKGQIIGTVMAFKDGETLGKTELISAEDREMPLSSGNGGNLIIRLLNLIKSVFI